MKRWLTILMCLMLCIPCAAAEEPETYESGYFTYTILEDGTAEIVYFAGYGYDDTKLVIPEELDGLTVTSIGDSAFRWCDDLTSIILPDTVAHISEKSPFSGCRNLTSIRVSPDHPTLATSDGVLFCKPDKRLVCYPAGLTAEEYAVPQGIREIGPYAFYFCENLTSIVLPDSVTDIFPAAFGGCKNLTNINLPDSLTAIDHYVFIGCMSLTGIDLPDSITSIGDGAFAQCASLAGIDLPDSVTSIGNGTFSYCVSLTEIVLPSTLTAIGRNPFEYCGGRMNIQVGPDHPTLEMIDGVLFYKPEKKLVCCSAAFTAEEYAVPEGVRAIDSDAFSECKTLTGITLPDTLTSIGVGAFESCENLTSITLPDTVTSIGYRAFSGCENLTSIALPKSVKDIGDSAFAGCPDLTLTVVRDSYAMRYCRANQLNYRYTDSDDWLLS